MAGAPALGVTARAALRHGWVRPHGMLWPDSPNVPRIRCAPGWSGFSHMLESLSVRTFKSLEDVTVDLGLVNVFIGANGSGKSNLLEALGVLSSAADGKVDDQSLKSRGVRPGVPRLYKSSFPARPGTKIPSYVFFGARTARAKYEVSLHNRLNDPAPAWRFKTELWEDADDRLVGRSPATKTRGNPERGMAALKAVDAARGDALDLLELLQKYVIFSPTTPVLRSEPAAADITDHAQSPCAGWITFAGQSRATVYGLAD